MSAALVNGRQVVEVLIEPCQGGGVRPVGQPGAALAEHAVKSHAACVCRRS
ncbi:hypothetical protein [Saccharopolyspora hattusasensis]|uniref:hypothetical protein n=1 Tax=Saccharopolyspora hattusasensis TaxID=1128679 RepID=UPI003D95461C